MFLMEKQYVSLCKIASSGKCQEANLVVHYFAYSRGFLQLLLRQLMRNTAKNKRSGIRGTSNLTQQRNNHIFLKC